MPKHEQQYPLEVEDPDEVANLPPDQVFSLGFASVRRERARQEAAQAQGRLTILAHCVDKSALPPVLRGVQRSLSVRRRR